jgi:hypothetical protein
MPQPPGRARTRGVRAAEAPPPLPLGHPAMAGAVLLVAIALLLCVTYQLIEPDFWQHLLVGKAIWQGHAVPSTNLWTWPTYGQSAVTPSWLFRALVWPLWDHGGIWGLFLWRWLSTLLAFGLLWATARRMGARGFAALGVLMLCGLAYRTRSQVRPETLVSVLVALQIWILETRRLGGKDRSPWLVAIACVWINAHISYYLGFVILGAYLLDDLLRARRGPEERRRALRLAIVGLAAGAFSFVNPFGWRALWEPFDYVLHLRHEPLFQGIDELRPYDWRAHPFDGLLLLFAGWPILILARLRRRGLDPAEIVSCAFFTALALSGQRFIGCYALVAAPFMMRDVEEWASARRWPRWARHAWVGAGCIAVLTALVAYEEITRRVPRAGIGIDQAFVPVRACDFIAEQGIRGRCFNQFYLGGYLLYRFWPDRGRLPYLDIHQSGGPDIRLLYTRAFFGREGWLEADRRLRFEWVVLDRYRYGTSPLFDVLDADSSWALVFCDDAAAVYVRRGGDLDSVAGRWAYQVVPAGTARLAGLGEACARDARLRGALKRELQHAIDASPWNSGAVSLLADVALVEGRYGDAKGLLERALASSPTVGGAYERLGLIALVEGRAHDALQAFEHERALGAARPGIALNLGRAWQGLGDRVRAERWYRRELERYPENQEARDSLQAIGARPGN